MKTILPYPTTTLLRITVTRHFFEKMVLFNTHCDTCFVKEHGRAGQVWHRLRLMNISCLLLWCISLHPALTTTMPHFLPWADVIVGVSGPDLACLQLLNGKMSVCEKYLYIYRYGGRKEEVVLSHCVFSQKG